MSRIGRIALLALVLPALPAAAAASGPSSVGSGALVYTVTLDDVIHPISAHYLEASLDRANAEKAALVIVMLNTPGGLVSSMEDMISAMTSSRAPVVVFVNGSKAASAGFFLTIAADVAVMAPGTRFGAAHPVLLPTVGTGSGEPPKDSTIMMKAENDLAAYARSLATNRGRNAKAAEEAVRRSASYTEREALALGLIDLICHDQKEILAALDGRTIRRFDGSRQTLHLAGARVITLDMTARERFLSFLADPTLAIFLLFAGIVSLYIEFTHPGIVAPGIIGALCLILFIFSTQALPVNWVGITLVILGIVLFLLELKIPSYGTLTAGGVACLILGALMLFKSSEGLPGASTAVWVVLSISASAAIIMTILTTLVVRSRRRRPTTGAAGLIAEVGTALSDLAPEGRVFVHGESWNARARVPVMKGAKVRVTGMNNLTLDVEEIS
jgi:membrane-bound serine protease (ClpP class)